MKFNVKKFVIVLVSIMAVSFLISGILFYISGGIKSASVTSGQVKTMESFETLGIEKIVINTVSTDIKILPSTDKDITVDFYGSTTSNLGDNSPKLITDVKNGVLNINISYPKIFSLGLFNMSILFLDIYIPSEFAKEVNAASISGDINIENFSGEKIKLKNTSGDIAVKSTKVSEIQTESISGDVYFEKVEGGLEVSTVSGEVNAGLISLIGDVLIKTTSGEIKLIIPSSSMFAFELDSISGDIKNNFDSKINFENERSMQGNVGKGINIIKITSVSGEILIIKE